MPASAMGSCTQAVGPRHRSQAPPPPVPMCGSAMNVAASSRCGPHRPRLCVGGPTMPHLPRTDPTPWCPGHAPCPQAPPMHRCASWTRPTRRPPRAARGAGLPRGGGKDEAAAGGGGVDAWGRVWGLPLLGLCVLFFLSEGEKYCPPPNKERSGDFYPRARREPRRPEAPAQLVPLSPDPQAFAPSVLPLPPDLSHPHWCLSLPTHRGVGLELHFPPWLQEAGVWGAEDSPRRLGPQVRVPEPAETWR